MSYSRFKGGVTAVSFVAGKDDGTLFEKAKSASGKPFQRYVGPAYCLTLATEHPDGEHEIWVRYASHEDHDQTVASSVWAMAFPDTSQDWANTSAEELIEALGGKVGICVRSELRSDPKYLFTFESPNRQSERPGSVRFAGTYDFALPEANYDLDP